MRPPDKRKPAAGKATGFLENIKAVGAFDRTEDSAAPHSLQAFQIRRRFVFSWPLARVMVVFAGGRL